MCLQALFKKWGVLQIPDLREIDFQCDKTLVRKVNEKCAASRARDLLIERRRKFRRSKLKLGD